MYEDDVPEDELVDLDTVDDELADRHADLIDQNSRMVKSARSRAKKMFDLADKFDMMADNCREIGALHIMSMRQLSETLADMINGEFDIDILSTEEEDDE